MEAAARDLEGLRVVSVGTNAPTGGFKGLKAGKRQA